MRPYLRAVLLVRLAGPDEGAHGTADDDVATADELRTDGRTHRRACGRPDGLAHGPADRDDDNQHAHERADNTQTAHARAHERADDQTADEGNDDARADAELRRRVLRLYELATERQRGPRLRLGRRAEGRALRPRRDAEEVPRDVRRVSDARADARVLRLAAWLGQQHGDDVPTIRPASSLHGRRRRRDGLAAVVRFHRGLCDGRRGRDGRLLRVRRRDSDGRAPGPADRLLRFDVVVLSPRGIVLRLNRGDAAAATWIFRGGKSRRRRVAAAASRGGGDA